jgi:hypothetical protein
MLHNIPEFDHYYVAYLKADPAKEPIAVSYSAPGVLAEAAHKTGRRKDDLLQSVASFQNSLAGNVMTIAPKQIE